MKLIIVALSCLLSSHAFADARLLIQGLNDEILLRSPAGVQIGIRFDDGAIISPSFSLEELRSGVVEKTIYEEGRSIVACTYNWVFFAKADDLAPRNFQGVTDANCKVANRELIVEAPASIRNVLITVEKSAFDSRAATHLILTISAEDSASSAYRQIIQQIMVNQTPMTIEKKFVQIANSDLNFILKPLWLRRSGNIQDDPIIFHEEEFTLR